MENYIDYYNVLSDYVSQQQADIQKQTTEMQEKAGVKQAEETGGVMGLFKVKELIAGKIKDVLKKKFEQGVEKAKGKVEELKGKAIEKAQQVKEDVMGQVQEAIQPTEEAGNIVEGFSKVREGDTLNDILEDPEKFAEYAKAGVDDNLTGAIQGLGKDITNDDDIEEVRGALKDIRDNPEGEAQEEIAQNIRQTIPYPKEEAIPAEQEEFISPEITGALRGDSTLARTLGLGRPPQEIEMKDLSAGQTEEQQADQAIAKTATKETEETTGKTIGETAGEEGAEVAGEEGAEIAGESVLASIPGLDLLAPVVMLGSALSALFGHKKHELQTPQFNPSYQFL